MRENVILKVIKYYIFLYITNSMVQRLALWTRLGGPGFDGPTGTNLGKELF